MLLFKLALLLWHGRHYIKYHIQEMTLINLVSSQLLLDYGTVYLIQPFIWPP